MSGLARRVAMALLIALPTAASAQPVPLTLAEATARALQQLPEVAIQRDAVAIAAQGETRAEAAYDSVLRIDSRVRSRTDPINTLFVGAPEGALAPRTNSLTGSVAWSRLFESGATITGTASTSLERTNGRFFLLTPAYFTGVGVELRQPLMAGRRLDPQRRALKVSALDVTRSRAALERLVSDTVAAVERAYWAVQFMREDVSIRERSLALAEAQRDDTAVRIEAGIAAEAELAAPQAEIARRRADLVRARDEALRAEIGLRQFVAATADSPAWSTAFTLTDEPPAPAPLDASRSPGGRRVGTPPGTLRRRRREADRRTRHRPGAGARAHAARSRRLVQHPRPGRSGEPRFVRAVSRGHRDRARRLSSVATMIRCRR